MEILVRNADLQARLVSDLLDPWRLQRGRLLLQRAPVELGKVAAAAFAITSGRRAASSGATSSASGRPISLSIGTSTSHSRRLLAARMTPSVERANAPSLRVSKSTR